MPTHRDATSACRSSARASRAYWRELVLIGSAKNAAFSTYAPHREFYRYLDHAEMGSIPYAGHQFRIRGYPSGARFPAPVLGEHSFEVLRDILGMSDEEIAAAFAGDAIAWRTASTVFAMVPIPAW